MEASDLYTALQHTGYPVAYRAFKSATTLPFICYLLANEADLMADGENYCGLADYTIELYSANKDPTAEAAIESALRGLGLPWAKSEQWISTENMLETLYDVRLIEGVTAVS